MPGAPPVLPYGKRRGDEWVGPRRARLAVEVLDREGLRMEVEATDYLALEPVAVDAFAIVSNPDRPHTR